MKKDNFFTEEEIYLFHEGTFYNCYLKFGAHRVKRDKIWGGFQWLEVENRMQSVFIFLRRSLNLAEFVLVILNFQPQVYHNYRVGVPFPGNYQEILNTDDNKFGGSGQKSDQVTLAKKKPWHGMEYSIKINLPPLAGVIIERVIGKIF